MRKLSYLMVLIVIFGLIISGCIFHMVPPLGQDGSIDIVKDAVSYKTNLITGQHTVAGFITVSNDGETLIVTYETVDNWLINETHLYVGTTIPTNSTPGKFPYKHEELGGITTDTYEIPLDDLGVVPCDIVYIAAHAELVKGETEETGWAKGVKIRPGTNWAMYFKYITLPCGSEIPELTEAISQEIDLSIGGTVEVTDPENIIYGVKLIIPPIPSEKKGGKLIANITISYIDDPYSLELPENRGFLLPPVVINSDILFDAECILEIPYTEDNLSNLGFSSNEDIKIYYYNYYTSSWEEVSINKRNNRAEIDFDYMQEFTITIDDINMTYACSTPSFVIPLPIEQGFPQPGDLLYKLSIYGISEGWIPGHVGIYVGEHEKDSEGDPYNVIEALWDGGVQRNYYNPISEFSGRATYMGAKQPKDFGPLTSVQRKYIVDYVESLVGLPYAGIQTTVGALYGMARGELVKGDYGTFNCVGLAEAAYELPLINGGVGLVSDKDEGNTCLSIYHYTLASCALTPADQYDKTEPAEGYSVSGKVTDSQGVKIADVTLNFELVTFNNNYSDSFKVTTDSNGEWSSDKLGREWKVTPQKDEYTFEPSTIKVKEDANGINFTGIFITGSQYLIQWSTAESNGWANPLGEEEELITSTEYDYNSDIYLQKRGRRHVGVDIHAQNETNVYAIADGIVDYVFTQDSWYDKYGILRNHSVIFIKHTNSNNKDFFAIYGHVFAKDGLGSTVKVGEKIGVVKESGTPCHLHFGINTFSNKDDFYYGIYGWGRIPADADPSEYGWVDPIDYLNTHSIENIILNSITVSPSTMSLVEGDSQTISSITAHYSDDGTADIALDACTYDSSNTGVTTVNNGVITAITTGIATITVRYTEDGISKTDTVEVTVTAEVVGQISGSVKDAVIQSPLQGVSVKVYDGNLLILISSGTTDSSGVYSISVPAGSGYRVEFTKSGYIPAIYYDVSVVAYVTTYLEIVLQIDDSYSGEGNISGTISNALTGGGVSGLTIKLRGGINITSGTVITSTATESGGYYSVNLNAGYYTAEVSGTGYNTTYFTVICIGGTTTANQNATITPFLSPGETRIILTWGETPRDLDSHLTGPLPDGTRFHMYYWHAELCESGCSEDGSPWPEYVKLDKDDTSSYGPETTTIYQQISGVYRFSVHDYTNRDSSYSTALSNSGAQVRVYHGNNLIVTFNVPANQEGTLWTVFEMDGDTIIPINTMSYESNPSVVRQSSASDAELMKNLPPKR